MVQGAEALPRKHDIAAAARTRHKTDGKAATALDGKAEPTSFPTKSWQAHSHQAAASAQEQ